MRILIEGADGTIFKFPENFKFNGISNSTRVNIVESVGKSGGVNVGNRQYNTQNITVSGRYKWNKNQEDKKLDVNRFKSNAMRFFTKNAPLKLFVNDYYEQGKTKFIKNLEVSSSNYTDIIFSDFADISFEFTCPDPYWYYYLDSKKTFNLTNGQIFLLQNHGDEDVYVKLDITSVLANTLIRFVNTSDLNRTTQIAYPFATAGGNLIIDGGENEVTFNSQRIFEYFNGNYLKIVSGDNYITYTGLSDIVLNVEWYNAESL